MEKSLRAIFDKIHCTIAHGFRPDFEATLNIFIKSKFDQNLLKLDTEHKDMYMYQKKL